MIKIKYPKNLSVKKIKTFFIKKGLKELVRMSNERDLDINEMVTKNSYKPDLVDLYRLYCFTFLNKRTTILEFGSGWSSLVIAIALTDLKKKYSRDIKALRRNNPFELFIVDNEKKFLSISKKRMRKYKKLINIKINFLLTNVKMTTYNGIICNEYEKLPKSNPDLIYLDGPDQFNIKGSKNGININHIDLLPLNNDLLKIEYFLIPGTILILDGRGGNASFLKNNLQRKWSYKYQKKFDQHIFCLNDLSIGKYNDLQLKFYRTKN